LIFKRNNFNYYDIKEHIDKFLIKKKKRNCTVNHYSPIGKDEINELLKKEYSIYKKITKDNRWKTTTNYWYLVFSRNERYSF